MRTTLTLDPDVAQLIKDDMHATGATFKQSVNRAIRRGLGPASAVEEGFVQRTYSMGSPRLDLTHVHRLLADLDADEYLRNEETNR